jgi:hypothetical protein
MATLISSQRIAAHANVAVSAVTATAQSLGIQPTLILDGTEFYVAEDSTRVIAKLAE